MKSVKTILAVGAHPDDIEFGCGGILLKEAEEGASIHFLVCSRGEAGSNGSPDERVAECRKAARLLGAELAFLDFGGDARIEYSRANALRMAKRIREIAPAIVLAPSLEDNQHPDHSAVGRIVRDAARFARYAGIEELKGAKAHAIDQLFYYAITPGAEPARSSPFLVDLGPHLERWRELMSCHASQLATRKYIDLQIARARVWGLQCDCEYAQAVYPNDPIVLDSISRLGPSARHF